MAKTETLAATAIARATDALTILDAAEEAGVRSEVALHLVGTWRAFAAGGLADWPAFANAFADAVREHDFDAATKFISWFWAAERGERQ